MLGKFLNHVIFAFGIFFMFNRVSQLLTTCSCKAYCTSLFGRKG